MRWSQTYIPTLRENPANAEAASHRLLVRAGFIRQLMAGRLATGFDAPADQQIKTLVYVLDGQLTLVLLRGDHGLVEQKLADATDTTMLRAARADEIRDALGASPGSLGAVGVAGLPIIADMALGGRRGMFTGTNSHEVHLRGVDVDRDIEASRWAYLREVTRGEQCPVCGQPLAALRAIEVGHQPGGGQGNPDDLRAAHRRRNRRDRGRPGRPSGGEVPRY